MKLGRRRIKSIANGLEWNLLIVIMMFKIGIRLLRDYDKQLRSGKEPRLNVEDYADLDIDRRAWSE